MAHRSSLGLSISAVLALAGSALGSPSDVVGSAAARSSIGALRRGLAAVASEPSVGAAAAATLASAAAETPPEASPAPPNGIRRARALCDPGAGPLGGCEVRIEDAGSASTSAGSAEGPATAQASYAPAGANGWPQFEVSTRSAEDGVAGRSLEQEAFAAGLLEGALTCEDLANYLHNVRTATSTVSDEAMQFVKDQDKFVREQAKRGMADDDYWLSVAMVLAQFDGLLHGHNTYCPGQRISHEDLLLLNLDGDMFDIMVALPSEDSRLEALVSKGKLTFLSAKVRNGRPLRCSALFKLLPNGSDVYFGHDTWDTYAAAGPRLFKTYVLPVRRNGKLEKHIDSFSSSPGYLSSMDDYYLLGGTSSMAVIETSLDVNNMSSYDALTPNTVPCWLRVMASNMLAQNPEDWTRLFSRLHSGTYNNQWMLFDIGAFSSKGLVAGSFWVLEEAPGLIVSKDMSEVLRKDLYWPSFNVAFFPEIRELINETESWTQTSRAVLFKELQGNATSPEGMKRVMGWNDFFHDPVSQGDPTRAIMARGDFVGESFGGLDSKVSSAALYKSGMSSLARVGPTHDDLPPFCWNSTWYTSHKPDPTPHRGQPECFDFSWGVLWAGRILPTAVATGLAGQDPPFFV